MKPIELELMTQYRYLSSLGNAQGKLLYVDTVAEMEANDYSQRLHVLNPETKEEQVIAEDKRVSYTVLKNGKLLVKDVKKSEFIETSYSYLTLDGKREPAFTLPLAASSVTDLNDDYYLVSATVTIDCPNYHKLDEAGKKAYHDHVKAEEDYLILDEYPFFFNGAGFINGTRNGLFLVSKKDYTCEEIVPSTMDVDGVQIDGNKVYILGTDYESFKDIYPNIYEFDVDTCKLTTIYENKKVYVRRICMVGHTLYALASIKTCICGQDFYKVEDGELKLAVDTEWMLNNSVGTDCRYGSLKTNANSDDLLYLVNTIEESSYVFTFDGESLVQLTGGDGSVDAITLMDGKLYTIAMQGQKLQEIYVENNGNLEQITNVNTALFEDKYVALPEKLNFFHVDEVHGLVLKPIDFDPEKKYPMILDIHGGPKGVYGPVFYHEMQLWASMGYFVVFCNPHCSDGRGDDFSDYIKHYGSTDYEDLMVFVDKVLETYPQIDKDKLAVTGGSYGGYMTNFIITHTDRFKVAASQRSISNRVSDYYYSDYSYDVTHENGVPWDDDFIKLSWDRSPIKYAKNAKTPTLFIQSTEDYRCPFPEALQLFSALKWNGVETRICGFKGENHELSRNGKPLHRLRRLTEITNWIDSHIKG